MNKEKWIFNKDLNISDAEKEATKKAVDEHLDEEKHKLTDEIIKLEKEIVELDEQMINSDFGSEFKKIENEINTKRLLIIDKEKELKKIEDYLITKDEKVKDISFGTEKQN